METRTKRIIAEAFERCPLVLRKLANKSRLTVTLSVFNRTFENNFCTIYGTSPEYGDPHLEVGKVAIGAQLPPFVCHEACHLWWRRQLSEAQRLKYIKALLVQMSGSTQLDVTEYAHEYWVDFKDAVRGKISAATFDKLDPGAWMKLRRFAEESFCESVAKLSFPDYKSDEDWRSTVDLNARRLLIESLLCMEVA
ncbi:MAG: hypothetical protein IPG59_12230 [Candidatus Melainabacteria bacterium]|nr:MAG: hypothetical protein IPG59_12230 [Candidatus Melainabacteria bacterium]